MICNYFIEEVLDRYMLVLDQRDTNSVLFSIYLEIWAILNLNFKIDLFYPVGTKTPCFYMTFRLSRANDPSSLFLSCRHTNSICIHRRTASWHALWCCKVSSAGTTYFIFTVLCAQRLLFYPCWVCCHFVVLLKTERFIRWFLLSRKRADRKRMAFLWFSLSYRN